MISSFDTETALIRPGLLAPPLTCVTRAWRESATLQSRLLDHVGGPHEMRHLLGSDAHLVGANTAYDMAVLAAERVDLLDLIFKAYDANRVHDVQLRQKLIDLARGELGGYFPAYGPKVEYGYSLAALVLRHIGKDRSASKKGPDIWRLRYGELRGVPLEAWPQEAKDYALEDATDTLLVWETQEKDVGLIAADMFRQTRAHFSLHLLSVWGVKTSAENIARLDLSVRATYERITQELIAAGLVRKDGTRDTKKAKRLMVETMAALGEPVKLTDTGLALAKERGKTDATLASEEVEQYAALNEEACRDSLNPILEAYAERTSISTVVDNHIPALLLGVVTPIQARFEPILETGRISCKFREDGKGDPQPTNGYQLTNVRRLPGIRECFVPRPGSVFYDYDYEQLELRTVAEVLVSVVGWSKLADALNAGMDVHLLLASRILGISYDEAKARKKEPEVSEARQHSKPGNFGFPGGMGPRGFQRYASAQYGVKLTIEKCYELKEGWLQAFPEFREYFEFVKLLCEEHGVATLRQLYSERIRGRVPYTAACNGWFQALGADVAKSGLWAVSRACFTEQPCSQCGGNGVDAPGACDRCHGSGVSPLFGTRPWNFVHDQVIGEADEEIAHEAAMECRSIMVEEGNKWLPHVPLPLGEAVLSRVWSKRAEPVWLNGRLIPWSEAIGDYRDAKIKLRIAVREGLDKSPHMVEAAWAKLDERERTAMQQEESHG